MLGKVYSGRSVRLSDAPRVESTALRALYAGTAALSNGDGDVRSVDAALIDGIRPMVSCQSRRCRCQTDELQCLERLLW